MSWISALSVRERRRISIVRVKSFVVVWDKTGARFFCAFRVPFSYLNQTLHDVLIFSEAFLLYCLRLDNRSVRSLSSELGSFR